MVKMIAVLTLPGLLIAFSVCSFINTVGGPEMTKDYSLDQFMANLALGDVPIGLNQALALEDDRAADIDSESAEVVLPVPKGAEAAPDRLWGPSVIWGEAEMTVGRALALGATGLAGRDTSEVMRVRYPKVVMIRDSLRTVEDTAGVILFVKELRFIGPSKEIKKEMPLTGLMPVDFDYPGKDTLESWGLYRGAIVVSSNNKYLCVSVPYPTAATKAEPDYDTKVLDTDGNQLWEIRHRMSEVALSTNGRYIVGENGECGGHCPVKIYGEKGKIGEIRRGVRDEKEGGSGSFDVAFAPDGTYFALITETTLSDKSLGSFVDRLRAHLVVVDENGVELSRREDISAAWPVAGAPTVSILEDGTIRVVTHQPEEQVSYFDKEGRELTAR